MRADHVDGCMAFCFIRKLHVLSEDIHVESRDELGSFGTKFRFHLFVFEVQVAMEPFFVLGLRGEGEAMG